MHLYLPRDSYVNDKIGFQVPPLQTCGDSVRFLRFAVPTVDNRALTRHGFGTAEPDSRRETGHLERPISVRKCLSFGVFQPV